MCEYIPESMYESMYVSVHQPNMNPIKWIILYDSYMCTTKTEILFVHKHLLTCGHNTDNILAHIWTLLGVSCLACNKNAGRIQVSDVSVDKGFAHKQGTGPPCGDSIERTCV